MKSHESPYTEDLVETNKTFPQILRAILDDPNQQALQWLEDGKSFMIVDRSDLVERVLPSYFGRATRYASFTRKLSRWKFRRMNYGPEEGAWSNEEFTRDSDSTKLKSMECEKRKKKMETKTVTKSVPVPNCYSIPLKKRRVDTSLFKRTEPSESTTSSWRWSQAIQILPPASYSSLMTPSLQAKPPRTLDGRKAIGHRSIADETVTDSVWTMWDAPTKKRPQS